MNSVFYYVLTESDLSNAIGRPVFFNSSGQLKYTTSTDDLTVGIIIDVNPDNSTVCVGMLKQVLKCLAKDNFTPTIGGQVLLSKLYNVTAGTELGMLGYAISTKDNDGFVQVLTGYFNRYF